MEPTCGESAPTANREPEKHAANEESKDQKKPVLKEKYVLVNYFIYFWPNFCNTRSEFLILQAILRKANNLGNKFRITKKNQVKIFHSVFIFSITANRL